MTKKELRAQIRGRLSVVSKEYKAESSRKITELLLSCEEYKSAKSIFIYISTENEPCTDVIISDALLAGKAVYVPKCLSKGIMVPVLIDENTQYEEGYMGIREPSEYDNAVCPSEIDLSVIPCMSASPDGKRIGHGAGFYDIFLSKTKTYKLCLCFGELMYDNIPADENDIIMNCIVSESGFFRI